MRFMDDEDRAKRKVNRKRKRRRTLASIKYVIARLVGVADQLFPEDGKGPERKAWVIEQTAKHVRTPLDDEVEEVIVAYLIELAVDEL